MGYGMRDFFIFGNIKSAEYNAWIGGSGTFAAPSRDITEVTVPGRNGSLTIDNGRYKNVTLTYEAFIPNDFETNFNGLKAALLSQKGNQRLEDTFHLEHFRRGRFNGNIKPDMWQKNRAGSFELEFDCDARLFLKSGEETHTLTASGSLMNDTLFEAKPMIRAYGTGSFAIGGYTITISSADVYTDIDLETMNAYKGSTNKNAYVTIPDGACLVPGVNNIAMSGITKLEIIPRWWTL